MVVAAFFAGLRGGRAATPSAEVLEVRKIWDAGAHNAFTDLIRWRDRWWCTFREADAHVGGDGAIRVITSTNGTTWESAARITEAGIDLRDPKFSVTPAGKLMIVCGGSVYEGTRKLKGRQSRVLFSDDGRAWTPPQRVLAEGDWLWRVTWHEGVAYGAAYRSGLAGGSTPGPEWTLAIYRSSDALKWTLVKETGIRGRPNETTLRFDRDGTMIALVRREAEGMMGYVGTARPPFTEWKWQESNFRFGGQNFIQLPDRRWIVASRDHTSLPPGTKGAQTMVAQLETNGHLTRLATLPSGGDTSYPGLVWHDGVLWVSYYSSHEGKTSIYLARVKLRD
jgi:hypothetical protein